MDQLANTIENGLENEDGSSGIQKSQRLSGE